MQARFSLRTNPVLHSSGSVGCVELPAGARQYERCAPSRAACVHHGTNAPCSVDHVDQLVVLAPRCHLRAHRLGHTILEQGHDVSTSSSTFSVPVSSSMIWPSMSMITSRSGNGEVRKLAIRCEICSCDAFIFHAITCWIQGDSGSLSSCSAVHFLSSRIELSHFCRCRTCRIGPHGQVGERSAGDQGYKLSQRQHAFWEATTTKFHARTPAI